jgi:flagellar hook protein FlgE
MSIVSSLYTGASGLQTLGASLQVVGNNIANVNTVGYKSSRVAFADLLSQNLTGSSMGSQIGRGVELTGVNTIFSQGAFSNTSRVTDLAISGNGFFVVSDGIGDFYTRDGQFSLDENGNFVNLQGLAVQGFQFDSTGTRTGVVGDISLSNMTAPPEMTANVEISANLDAGAQPPVGGFQMTDPAATSNFSTSITIVDSLGNNHVMSVYFEKTNDATDFPPGEFVNDLSWEWHGVFDGGDLAGGTAGTPTEVFSGTMTFNPDGSLRTVSQAAGTANFAGGAEAAQLITLNFGTPTGLTPGGPSGLDGTTQFAGPQVVNFQTEDGFRPGQLQAIDIDETGLISGIFSNGRTRAVGQVALANFQNSEGLFKIGGNLYVESLQSGIPTIGEPSTGSLGSIASATLELSNVDITNEFITMITNQRGFQANSRVIVVGDELLQDVVNLT